MSLESVVALSVEIQYERAYAELSNDVFRFALAWTNDWSTAEDLTQEAYLRLWSHRTSVDWGRPLLPWLMVATRHLAQNRFRALRRGATLMQPRGGALDEQLLARWIDVRRAMTALTPLERSALVLTAIQGWSYRAAAEVLHSTDGALRAAVSRARDKLEVA